MTFIPWQFVSPYISYTPIIAHEMNDKLTGISQSFTYIADQLNNFVPALPSNFTGNNKAVDGPYHNTLLAISPEGNFELVSRGAFSQAIGRDLTIEKTTAAAFTVTGDNHAKFYACQNNDANPEGVTAVTVGEAIAMVDGEPVVSEGTVIFFTQLYDTPLVFVEAPGVDVITPGLLKCYGPRCTVALVAIDQYTWVLTGEVYLDAEIVP